ncbi:MAG: hypothetical protein ACP5JG_08115, partial [Anaerolineae bacterium]
LYPPLERQTVVRIVIMTTFMLPGVLKADWRRVEIRWLGVWALVVASQIFVFETPDRPRLLLPLVPPLALLVASGWARVRLQRFLGQALVALLALALLLQTAPLVAQLSQTAAPPARAAAYISRHYDSSKTLIAAAGSFRAVQVELPDYPAVYLYQFDPSAALSAIEDGRSFVAIFDRDQFPAEVIDLLSQGGSWVTVEDLTFSRERSIHTQHDQVRVQVLAPADQVPVEALRLPADGCIDLGRGDEGRYLGQGWFRPEDIGGVQGRWAGQTLTTSLRLNLPEGRDYTLYLRVMAYPTHQQITVRTDAETLGTKPLPPTWGDVEIELPADARPTKAVVHLSLIHAASASPYDVTDGGSSDRRELTAAYDRICFLPAEPTTNGEPTEQSSP